MADCTSAKTRAAILRRRALAIAFGAACVAGVSSAALAQKRATSIEEVVVTAQQREQSLRDVPISISAFNNDAIESAMMGDVGDYVVRTPNASFISNGARSRRQVSMRGITNFAGENDPVRSSTFGFYIDGFNLASASINPPIMDVERIEILRGPQATYFGGNALGGGINMTTVEPDSTAWGGSLMVDYARFDTRDIEGILNVPIIQDVLAARINFKQFSTFAGETLFAGFPDRDGCAGGQLCDSGNRRQHSAYQCGSGACQR